MIIYVDGKEACIKKDSEFEFVSENPKFSDTNGYSMSIEFPMGGDNGNDAIFGNLNRDDVDKRDELMECEIISGAFYKRGALAIIEVTESMVKGQFLEGVDADDDNDEGIDETFINDLELGSAPVTNPAKITPRQAREGTGEEVCLPWVPEGYDVANNKANSESEWSEETKRLTWQPYLLPIVRRIAEATGYSIDISALESSYWSRAIICNTLPPSWGLPDYKDAMPRWSVEDFFIKLGKFLKGSFSIDKSEKYIKFTFWEDSERNAGTVVIDDVIDSYSAAVTRDEEDADYLPIKNYRYKQSDSTIWKYLDCPWLLKGNWKIEEVDTVKSLMAGGFTYDDDGHRLTGGGPIFYCKEIDTYFVTRSNVVYSKGHTTEANSNKYPYAKFNELQPVNVFGPEVIEGITEYEELDICPVIVDYALEGKMMFLPVGSYDSEGNDVLDVDYFNNFEKAHGVKLSNGIWLGDEIIISQSRITHHIESHSENEEENGWFDCMYIGFVHDEMWRCPIPYTDVTMYVQNLMCTEHFMRLSQGGAGEVNPKVKYTFSFVADKIHNVNAAFFIHGKRYVCKKITATFSESGMSPIMKGEFFRID